MNKELLKQFYHQAVTKCEEGEAWEFERHFAQVIAEYCAGVCEEMGTATAGCDNGKPTKMADDCAAWIRKDFGI